MNNPFNFFNLSDFKKWVENHNEKEKEDKTFVGTKVKQKGSIENFNEKIQVEYGDETEIIGEFEKNGGVVIEQDGNKMLVDVSCGTFVCHKRFLRKSS